MATDPFEVPPRIGRKDEEGNWVFTPDEWQRFIEWLDRLRKHIADIT